MRSSVRGFVVLWVLLLGACGGTTDVPDGGATEPPGAGTSRPAPSLLEPFTVTLSWGGGPVSVDVPISTEGFSSGSLRFATEIGHAKIQIQGKTLRIVPRSGWIGVDSAQLQLEIPGRDTQRAWVRLEGQGPTVSDTSVRVLHSASPLTSVDRNRYLPGDVNDPRLDQIRPLVREILRDYGNPTSEWNQVRALRDWVARTAVHPYVPFHPDGSVANIAVLPTGLVWADFNASIGARETQDAQFWLRRHYDGFAMLDTLLGTYNSATSGRNDDGLLRHLDGARYQMRSLESFRSVYCSYQGVMLRTLLLSKGLHGIALMLTDHESNAVFLPSMAKWVYLDPTFNESFHLNGLGLPLSPLELFDLRLAGEQFAATRRRGLTPLWDDRRYIARLLDPRATYFGNNPSGMPVLGVVLNSFDAWKKDQWGGYYDQRLAMLDTPEVDNFWPFSRRDAYARLTRDEAFPHLGIQVNVSRPTMDSVVVQLQSNQPQAVALQRKVNGGAWTGVGGEDDISLLAVPLGTVVYYRSLDVRGNPSAVAELHLRGATDGISLGEP